MLVRTTQERFELFHENNPQVYMALVALARELVAKGYQKIGIKMLFEVVRWQFMLATTDSSEFKLNNNYHSRYARIIMQKEPDLRGVFSLRGLKTH